jgi:CubicO group peptidase (beta-lactamase class C family)
MTFLRVWGALLLAAHVSAVPAAELARATPEEVGLSSERLARLEQVLKGYADDDKLAGSVALIARHGKVAWEFVSGKQDVSVGTPMQADSLFRVWSMTKPITSVALLTLYEEGKFQLGDPAEVYIPAFKDLKVLEKVDERGQMVLVEQQRKMTVLDLFRHTAGFGYGFTDNLVDKAYKDAGLVGFDPIPLDKVVEALGKAPLNFQPGTRWQYSYAHDVQAWLVQRLSGMKFDEYLRKRLFEPLGMNDTSFGLPKDKLKRLTTVYGPKEPPPGVFSLVPLQPGMVLVEKAGEGPYLKHDKTPAGGTGLISTAEDYYRFAQMLVNGGEYNGARILSRKTVELMTANHVPPGAPGLLNPAVGYGLGVSSVIDQAGAGNLGSRGQFGWGGYASTYVIMDPVEKLVAILMVQYQPTNFPLWQQFQTLTYAAIAD